MPAQEKRIRDLTGWGLRGARGTLLLCVIHASSVIAADSFAREFHSVHIQAGRALVHDLRFTHLTTNEGLSQSYVNAIFQDRRGFMWLATRDGLNRYDGNSFVVYKQNPNDPNSLSANFVEDLIEDNQGYLWAATFSGGVDRFDPATERFTRYRHDPSTPNSIASDWVESIARDNRGRLWFGTGDSGLDKFDPGAGAFTHYLNDSNGRFVGEITDVIADSNGDLWFVGERGLFHLNSHTGTITRPRATIGLAADCVYEDSIGNLWMLAYSPIVGLAKYDRHSERLTKYPVGAGAVGVARSNLLADGQKGISRFDPQTKSFRNYDVSDGLQGNDFGRACCQGLDGEVLFGGSHGFDGFFHDDPYVPPVVITSFKIFNKAVSIGRKSVLKKAIPYVDALALSYRDSVFSFEFAALGYANSHKNRYRYKLEGFDAGWNEVDSEQRLATYTNLDAGKYVFRVQGSNCDGVWNEEGVSLPIFITPPWWRTNWFHAFCAAGFLTLLWAAYQFRVRQLRHEFDMRVEGRVEERTRIARELHDTLLQSFQGLMFSFQAARNLLPGCTDEAMRAFDEALREGDEAIAEGRDTIQGLRINQAVESNLEHLLTGTGKELARSSSTEGTAPEFQVSVEGTRQPLAALLQDEVYRIAREVLRNAFYHAQATRIEAEIAYDRQFLRLRIRDNGKGIDGKVMDAGARSGHWGLPGVRERAECIGAQLKLWSELGAGTEAELTVPARIAYRTVHRRRALQLFRNKKV